MLNDGNFREIIGKAQESGCEVLFDEPMKKHTTFKIGGNCKALIKLRSEESAAMLFSFANQNKIPHIVVGNGSNLLVSDSGFDGIVFTLCGELCGISLSGKNQILSGAGVMLSKLAVFAQKNSLSGLEFAHGIPGTVGGAVYMNAGAYGGEISKVLKSVTFADKNGSIKTLSAEELDFSYRRSIFCDSDCLIINALFELSAGDSGEIQKTMDELMRKRREKQPLEYPSAGSTFKRPQGAFAAQLIDECGLKGLAVGGAQVSEKHAGFVINKNNATCEDVKKLIDIIKSTVKEKAGYELECEIKIIG